MVLGKILQLDVPPSKPSSPVGAIKLEHTPGPAILTGRHFHGLVFLHRGLGQFLPEQENAAQRLLGRFQKLLHILLSQGIRLHTVLFQPVQHLKDRIGVLQAGPFLQGGHQAFPALGIQGHRLSGQFQINGNAPVVDFLVQVVFFPHFFRHRVLLQPLLDGHFHFYVSFVVAFEQIPFLRSMLGKVPCSAAVGLGFLAGNAKIPDQLPPFLHLLIVQIQHGPHSLQRKGQPQIGGPDHGTLPSGRIQEPGTFLG